MENQIKIREVLLETVNNLTDKDINEVIEIGTWSIAQVLEHLYIMEVNVTHQIQMALKQEYFDKPGTFPIHLIENRSEKINAPDFLIPSNKFHTLDELKQKLASSRASLEKIVQETSEEERNQKTFAHRRFGVMTLNHWISLIGYHEQRHIGQIEEIKEALTK